MKLNQSTSAQVSAVKPVSAPVPLSSEVLSKISGAGPNGNWSTTAAVVEPTGPNGNW